MDRNGYDNFTKRLRDIGGRRRTLLRLAGILGLPGLHAISAPAVRAAEVADAQCPPPGTISGYGPKRLAQTFKAQHTGRLTRSRVWAHSLSPSNTDDYLFAMRTATPKGKPSKTVLASAQVNDIVRSTFPQMTEGPSISQPPRVKKGERYALVITGVGNGSPNVQSNESPGCNGTLFDDNNLDNKFIKDTNADIVFATFFTTD